MRYSGIIFLVLAILVAGASTWLLNQWRIHKTFTEKLDTSQIDYYLSGFSLFVTDKEGNNTFSLSGEHFIHQRASKKSEIYKPVITVKHEDNMFNIQARKAEENKTGDMLLKGKVIIDKPANEITDGFTLNTSDLHYSPSQHMINTDAEVTLKSTNGSIITATGMSEDLTSQTTRLKSNVHAEYKPTFKQ